MITSKKYLLFFRLAFQQQSKKKYNDLELTVLRNHVFFFTPPLFLVLSAHYVGQEFDIIFCSSTNYAPISGLPGDRPPGHPRA